MKCVMYVAVVTIFVIIMQIGWDGVYIISMYVRRSMVPERNVAPLRKHDIFVLDSENWM